MRSGLVGASSLNDEIVRLLEEGVSISPDIEFIDRALAMSMRCPGQPQAPSKPARVAGS